MDKESFIALMGPVIRAVEGLPLDGDLAARLNRDFPPDSPTFKAIEGGCHAAVAAGWMCNQGKEGRRYGRVAEPGAETANMSIDVVQLRDIAGPHHAHPTGEICMTMPLTPGARFDGQGAGWCVYEPGSAHHPTVEGGEALVLYLLPEGKIHFTRR
jgi:hypothetical protein